MTLLWAEITAHWRNRSISSGTDADADLIPRFAASLYGFSRACWGAADALEVMPRAARHAEHSRVSQILTRVHDDRTQYFGTAQAHEDKLWLIERLNFYAPVGYSFRTDPGDGSNYGFWLREDT